jgi:hypothetical protein
MEYEDQGLETLTNEEEGTDEAGTDEAESTEGDTEEV